MMTLSSSFRLLRIVYWGTYLVALAIYLLFAGHDMLHNDVTTMYVVNLLCSLLTFLGCYVALGQPVFLDKLLKKGEEQKGAQKGELRWAWMRTLLFSGILLVNTFLYCIATYANAPKYCVLIALIIGIFVYPRSHSSFQSSES